MHRLLLAALFVTVPVVASAQEFPRMKPGLWQTATSSDQAKAKNEPPRVTSICMDPSVQKVMMQFSQGAMHGMCSKQDMKISGGTVTGDTICTFGGSKMTGHSVMKFSGDTAYHTDATSSYDPPFMGMKDAVTTIDGKYMGPCPADMQPGDLKMANGTVINLKTIAGAAGGK
jgi:hypothetical protein